MSGKILRRARVHPFGKNKENLKRFALLFGLLLIFGAFPILSTMNTPAINLNDNPIDDDNDGPAIPDTQNTGDPIADLRAMWSFQDTGIGYRNNDGAGSASYTTGYWGSANGDRALYVNNGDTTDSLQVSDSTDLHLQSSGFSWGAWIRPETFAPDSNGDWPLGRVLSKEYEWTLYVFHSNPSGYDGIGVAVWDSTGSRNQCERTQSSYAVNTWYHIMGVYSSGTLTLYINGESAASRSVGSLATPSSTHPLTIGSNEGGMGLEFKGRIDDARVYHRALTPTEIKGVMLQEIYYSNIVSNSEITSSTGWTSWAHGDGDVNARWEWPTGQAKFHNDRSGTFTTEDGYGYIQQSFDGSKKFASSHDTNMRVQWSYKTWRKGNEADCEWTRNWLGDYNFWGSGSEPGDWVSYDSNYDMTNYGSNYEINSYIRFYTRWALYDTFWQGTSADTYIDYMRIYVLWTPTQNPQVTAVPDIVDRPYTETAGVSTISWTLTDTCYTNAPDVKLSWTGPQTSSTTYTNWLDTESKIMTKDLSGFTPGDYIFTFESYGTDGYGGTFQDVVNVNIDPVVPGAPTWNTAELDPNGIVDLRWNVPSWNGGETVGYYGVYREGALIDTTTNTYYSDDSGQNSGGSMVGGNNYDYYIRAHNSAGYGTASTTQNIVFYEEPGQVGGLSVTGHGDETVSLSWSAVGYDGGHSASLRYRVEYRRSDQTWAGGGQVSGLTGTSRTVSGLTNGWTYYFRVVAYNNYGSGLASTVVSENPGAPPDEPVNLAYLGGSPVFETSYGDGWVYLQWDAPADTNGYAITNYEVYRSDTSGGTYVSQGTTGTTTSYQDSGLNNENTYFYKVRAYTNEEGWGPLSVYKELDPRTTPAQPTWENTDELSIEGNGYVDIDWYAVDGVNDGGHVVDSYNIYKRLAGAGTWDSPVSVSAPTTFYRYSGLTNGEEYEFQIFAVNDVGEGDGSIVRTFIPHVTLGAPDVYDVESLDGEVTISWNDPSNAGSCRPIDYFTIYYDTVSGGPYGSSTTRDASLSNTITISSLTNGQIYYFRISATDDITTEGALETEFWIRPMATPGAPGQPSVTAGNSQVDVSWSAGTSGGTGVSIDYYRVHRSDNGGSYTFMTDQVPEGDPTDWIDYSAQNDHDYRYRVQTQVTISLSYLDGVTDEQTLVSAWSTESAIAHPQTVPDAPSISATYGDEQNEISWTPGFDQGSDVIGFYVFRRGEGQSYNWNNPIYEPGPTDTDWTDTSVTNGESYWYTIIAENGVGNSSAATETAEIIPAGVPKAPQVTSVLNSSSWVYISWDLPSNWENGRDVDYFTIYRSPANSPTPMNVYDTINIATDGSLQTYNDSSVDIYNDYYYIIQAHNSEGDGDNSTKIKGYPQPGPPDPPSNVRTTDEGDKYVEIAWNFVEEDLDNGRFQNFTIYRGTYSTFTADESSRIATLTSNASMTYTDSDAALEYGETYYYKVRAANEKGDGLPSSATSGIPFTVPSQIQGVNLGVGDTQLTVSWTIPGTYPDVYFDGGRFVQHYRVYRSDDGGSTYSQVHQTLDGTTSQWIDEGLTNGITYYYKVSAYNEAGYGSNSTPVSEYPNRVPYAPTLDSATAVVGGVDLSWTAGGNGGSVITGYKIYRGTDPGSLTEIHEVTGIDSTTWTDNSVTYGQYYHYAIASINRAGTGDQSTTKGALPITTPSAPQNIEVTQVASQSVSIQWDAPADNGGSSITGYVVYQRENGGAWVDMGTQLPGDTDYTANSLTNGYSYTFKVAAYNNGSRTATPGGEGAESDVVCGVPITVPDAPSLQVVLVASETVNISWAEPGFTGGENVDISGYVVYRKVNPLGSWSMVGTNASDELSYYDTGLTNGYYYYYAVAAYNNGSRSPSNPTLNPGGEGPTSDPVCGRPITTPGAPNSIDVEIVDDSSVKINWTVPSFTGGVLVDIDGYIIYQKHETGNWIQIDRKGAGEYSCWATGLTNGDGYKFKVAAYNNGTWNNDPTPPDPDLNPGGEGLNTTAVHAIPITVPTAPQNLEVFQEYDQKLWLKWDAPADNGGESIDGYVLYRGNDPGNLQVHKIWYDPAIREFNDTTGVSNGLMYFYEVAAFNNGSRSPLDPDHNPGGEGPRSNTAGGMPCTVPDAPTNFRATSLDGRVLLEWDAPSGTGGIPLTGYVVYRGTSAGALTKLAEIGTSTQWYDDGSQLALSHGETYYYKIAAFNNGSVDAFPGGEGANATETPHATPTLYLEFTVLNATAGIWEGVEVSLNDLSGTYSGVNTTIADGTAGFGGLNNSNPYEIILRKNGYVVYNMSTYSIDTTSFTLSETLICNLTNVEFTLKDLTDNIVTDAYLELSDSGLGTTFSGTTDANGQIQFNEIYNATWDLLIKFTTGGNSYEFTVNDTDTYTLATNLEFVQLDIIANLTTVSINATDPAVMWPYDALFNANLTLIDVTSGSNITWFLTNSSGIAEFQVPADQYNLEITYLNKLRDYECQGEPITFGLSTSHTLDFVQYTEWHFLVEITEVATSIFCPEQVYIQPSWGSHDSNYDNTDVIPNYAELYYRDGITFTFFWQNNRDLSGVDNSTISASWNAWAITKGGSQVASSATDPYAIKPVSGETGNYTFQFNSNDLALTGVYQLDISLGDGDDYQLSYYSIEITVMNFTSQIQLEPEYTDIADRTCYYDQQMIIEFSYTSVMPVVENINSAVLNWEIVGQSVSGTLSNSGSGIYELSHVFDDLVPGDYFIRVYGNETNYDWASIQRSIKILSRPTSVNVSVNASYRISDSYIVTAWGESIIVDFELLDSLTTSALSDITVSITYNSSSIYTLASPYVTNVDSDTYRFEIPAVWSTEGIHYLDIVLSKQNYTDASHTINVQVENAWSTDIEIVTPPDSVSWNEEVEMILYYFCNQEPREGTALDSANITQLTFDAYIDGDLIQQVILDMDDWNTTWWYTNLGGGNYEVKFDSSVLNMTERILFYVTPLFNYSNYEDGQISPYLYVSPLETALDIYSPQPPYDSAGENFNFLEVDYELSGTVRIDSVYIVDQSGNADDGMPINGGEGYYRLIDRSDDSVVDSGSLTTLSGGRYYCYIPADALGDYKLEMWVEKENYYLQNTSFNFRVVKDIEFEVEADSESVIGTQSLKLAQNENITLIINVTDPLATDPTINIYIDGNLVSSEYVYNFETMKWKYTQPLSDALFETGTYTITVEVIEDQYNAGDMDLSLELIDYWLTTGYSEFETLELATWSENVTYNVYYGSITAPRDDNILDEAIISQLMISVKISGTEYIQKILDVDSINENWGYEYIEYDTESNLAIYEVWLNTAVLNLTDMETFKVYTSIQQEFYKMGTFDTYFWLDTANAALTSIDGDIIDMGMDYDETFEFRLNVSDPALSIYGDNIDGALISYVISNGSNPNLVSGQSSVNPGAGIYEINVDPIAAGLWNGTYTLTLNSVIENYTDASLAVTLEILPGAVKFNFTMGDEYRLSTYAMKVCQRENVTVDIRIDPLLDISDLVLDVNFGGTLLSEGIYQNPLDNHNYTIDFNATNYSTGRYKLTIEASKFGYASDKVEITVFIVEAWETDVEIYIPPPIKPWNSNVSMIFRYECIAEPREDTRINNAIISQLELSLITPTGTEQQLLLTENSELWGWENLASKYGDGLYRVWFNTSALSLPEVRSFYIIPTITDPNGIFEANVIEPYLWVELVETALLIRSDKVTNLATDGITMQLNETTTLEALLSVIDLESILRGSVLSGAALEYQVFNSTNDLIYSVPFGEETSVDGYNYNAILKGRALGDYTVRITANLLNYSEAIAEFAYTVIKRELSPVVTFNTEEEPLTSPQNRDLVMEINAVDQLTGEPLSGATLTVYLDDEVYTFEEDPETPGLYVITIEKDDIGELPENELYTMECTFSKTNYTESDFTVYLNVGFRVDPVFGIPYRYWTIAAVSIAAMVGIVTARHYYLKVTTPMTIQHINKAAKIIKKERDADVKKLENTRKEEMYDKFADDWKLLRLDMSEALELEGKKSLKPEKTAQEDSVVSNAMIVDMVQEELKKAPTTVKKKAKKKQKTKTKKTSKSSQSDQKSKKVKKVKLKKSGVEYADVISEKDLKKKPFNADEVDDGDLMDLLNKKYEPTEEDDKSADGLDEEDNN